MNKLIFTAYTDDKYSSKIGSNTILIDPDNLKFYKEIVYFEDKQLGTVGKRTDYCERCDGNDQLKEEKR